MKYDSKWGLVYTEIEFIQLSKYLDYMKNSITGNEISYKQELEKAYDFIGSPEEHSDLHFNLDTKYRDSVIEFSNVLYSNFVIIWFSFMEKELNEFIRFPKFSVIENDSTYNQNHKLSKIYKIFKEEIKYTIDNEYWELLVTIQKIRNILVHNGRKIWGTKNKQEKSSFICLTHNGYNYPIYFQINKKLYEHMIKFQIVKNTGFALLIEPNYEYCETLIGFGSAFFEKVYSDLFDFRLIR